MFEFKMKEKIDIYQISSSDYTFGCGFAVNGKFITAAHVIEDAINPYIRINEAKVPLKREEAIIYQYDKNNPASDLAIYDMPDIKSSLTLADYELVEGQTFTSISYREVSQGTELIECKAKIRLEREEYMFAADTDVMLKPGSSGSPLLDDKKVIGMLVRGKECTSMCVYLNSKAIINTLKQHNNGIKY